MPQFHAAPTSCKPHPLFQLPSNCAPLMRGCAQPSYAPATFLFPMTTRSRPRFRSASALDIWKMSLCPPTSPLSMLHRDWFARQTVAPALAYQPRCWQLSTPLPNTNAQTGTSTHSTRQLGSANDSWTKPPADIAWISSWSAATRYTGYACSQQPSLTAEPG